MVLMFLKSIYNIYISIVGFVVEFNNFVGVDFVFDIFFVFNVNKVMMLSYFCC